MDVYVAEFIETLKEQDKQIEEMLSDIDPQGINWRPKHNVNSIYVLITHIIGSRSYWINQVIGGQDIQRNRDAEFSSWGNDIQKLISNLHDTTTRCISTLENLRPQDFTMARQIRGKQYTVPWCLVHAIEHSGYHLGQIRLLKKQLNHTAGQV
ncbi:hypothetical protein AMJ86_08650 [bacterium SM23_57]|nr:MAG: hypothetical protein AMJ86_08650 [bacterium SM23_57]